MLVLKRRRGEEITLSDMTGATIARIVVSQINSDHCLIGIDAVQWVRITRPEYRHSACRRTRNEVAK